jgi:hypothetical protein
MSNTNGTKNALSPRDGKVAAERAVVAHGLNGDVSGMQSVVRISHAGVVYRLRQPTVPHLCASDGATGIFLSGLL